MTYDDRFDDPAVLDDACLPAGVGDEAAYPVTATRTLYVFARTDLLQ